MSKRILVLGDGIIDAYVFGAVNRKSPEDPDVSVLDIERTEYRLGGAYNVAANIKSLNREFDVSVSTAIMTDCAERMLKDRRIKRGLTPIDFFDWQFFPNTEVELVKTRIFDQSGKQLLRLDNRKQFSDDILNGYESYFKEEFVGFMFFDAVVVSDYDKGTVSGFILDLLHKCDKPLFIDTKKKDFSIWPNNENTLFKINFAEWSTAKNIDSLKNLIVTRGKLHTLLYKNNFPVGRSEVENSEKKVDVSGAGDVFLAGLVVKYLETDGDIIASINFANKIASRSVMKFGICEIQRKEL